MTFLREGLRQDPTDQASPSAAVFQHLSRSAHIH